MPLRASQSWQYFSVTFLNPSRNEEVPTWNDAQHGSLLEKCKSKVQWDSKSPWSEWPSSKNLQTINAREGVEKRESSLTVGGHVNWYSHYGRQYGDFLGGEGGRRGDRDGEHM